MHHILYLGSDLELLQGDTLPLPSIINIKYNIGKQKLKQTKSWQSSIIGFT